MMSSLLGTSPTITLHLGAHRTGTTRLQKILDGNNRVLAEHGLVALTPHYDGKRGEYTIRNVVNSINRSTNLRAKSPFSLKRFKHTRKARVGFDALCGSSSQKILLSDEVTLGPIFEKPTGRAIYRRAEGNLRALRRFLRNRVASVCLGVRSYETFLVSAYAMDAVRSRNRNHVPEFANIKTIINFDNGWVELVEVIRDVFPDAPLHVWRFEDNDVNRQLAILLGSELASKLSFDPHQKVNAAPSKEAIDFALSPDCPRHSNPDDLVRRFSSGAKWDPLSASEKAWLSKRYLDDIRRLSEISGVCLHE